MSHHGTIDTLRAARLMCKLLSSVLEEGFLPCFQVLECTVVYFKVGVLYYVAEDGRGLPSFKVLYCFVDEELFALARNQSGLRHMS